MGGGSHRHAYIITPDWSGDAPILIRPTLLDIEAADVVLSTAQHVQGGNSDSVRQRRNNFRIVLKTLLMTMEAL